MEVMWQARTMNVHTGDIPTCHVGSSPEQSRASCRGCALLHKKHGGKAEYGIPMCYSHYGTPYFAFLALLRRRESGEDVSLKAALADCSRRAKYARISAIGDYGAVDLDRAEKDYSLLRKEGLGVLAYTNKWDRLGPQKYEWFQSRFMASTMSMEQADVAVRLGWKATAIVAPDHPHGFQRTPDGNPAIVCPKEIAGSDVQCNDCGLCDVEENPGIVILFRDHGATAASAW